MIIYLHLWLHQLCSSPSKSQVLMAARLNEDQKGLRIIRADLRHRGNMVSCPSWIIDHQGTSFLCPHYWESILLQRHMNKSNVLVRGQATGSGQHGNRCRSHFSSEWRHAVNPRARGGRGQRTFLILFRFSESWEKCTEKENAIVVFQIYA